MTIPSICRSNVWSGLEQSVPTQSHGGIGLIRVFRPLDKRQLLGKCSFVDFAVLPPGTSIGPHRHSNDNEEIYFIVQGEGLMQINGQMFTVSDGDIVVNSPGGLHGLHNTGDRDLNLFVFEVLL